MDSPLESPAALEAVSIQRIGRVCCSKQREEGISENLIEFRERTDRGRRHATFAKAVVVLMNPWGGADHSVYKF